MHRRVLHYVAHYRSHCRSHRAAASSLKTPSSATASTRRYAEYAEYPEYRELPPASFRVCQAHQAALSTVEPPVQSHNRSSPRLGDPGHSSVWAVSLIGSCGRIGAPCPALHTGARLDGLGCVPRAGLLLPHDAPGTDARVAPVLWHVLPLVRLSLSWRLGAREAPT